MSEVCPGTVLGKPGVRPFSSSQHIFFDLSNRDGYLNPFASMWDGHEKAAESQTKITGLGLSLISVILPVR